METKKKMEMNLNLDYWKQRFLYPFALDPTMVKDDDSEIS